MTEYDWNKEKNELLKNKRGISFDEVVEAVESGKLIEIIDHRNKEQYPNQQVLIVRILDAVYCIPFVESGCVRFLKTIYRSSKQEKKYWKK